MARIPKPSGRRSRKTILVSYGVHLVYAEGKLTEPNYVKNIDEIIKRNHNFHNTNIIIKNVEHKGLSTIGLVEFAEEDVKKRLKAGEKIDHVWIFYDKDSFEQDDFDNAHFKIKNKNKSKYKNDDGDNTDKNLIRWHSLWSNECFEVWVLLHFEYLNTPLNRGGYIPKINKYFNEKGLEYTKNIDNLYSTLIENGDVNNAIQFAKKLEKENKNNNPSTGVYQFIEYFKRYLGIEWILKIKAPIIGVFYYYETNHFIWLVC